MSDEEIRITSETGGQKGQKTARLGGTDAGAMLELARVYGYGEEKYDRYNYLKGYPWSLSVDALFRHLLAFLAGEDRDPESGLLHTAHAAWHALTLTAFSQRGIGTDDRWKKDPYPYTIGPMTAPRLGDAGMTEGDWNSAINCTYADLLRAQGQAGLQNSTPDVEPGERKPHLGWCCAAPNAAPHDGPCRWCCYDALQGQYAEYGP